MDSMDSMDLDIGNRLLIPLMIAREMASYKRACQSLFGAETAKQRGPQFR